MEDNDTTPEGVKARFAKITEARNAATARADAAETQIATLQAQITEYGGKMEGFAALTQTNAELEAANASLSGKYSQLEGMVSAGFIDAEDRDLASYYHGKSGTDQPITEWAKTLSADNAPKGLSHPFAPAQATDTPPPPAAARPAATSAAAATAGLRPRTGSRSRACARPPCVCHRCASRSDSEVGLDSLL